MIKLFKAKSLKKTHEKEKSKGRSMVEMLGVLAIIGVLSIGGIQGYTMAMRKYRANEILNVLNKYALLEYSACQTAMEKDPQHCFKEAVVNEWIEWWGCPRLEFSNSGLGSLPQGISQMNFWGIRTSKNVESTGLPENTDYIILDIYFDSKELCEAVLTANGERYSYYGDEDTPYTFCSSGMHGLSLVLTGN